MNKFRHSYLLVKELGPYQLLNFAWYRMQLRSGRLEKISLDPCPRVNDPKRPLTRAFIFHPPASEFRIPFLLKAADEIAAGLYHPFSGAVAPLDLTLPAAPLKHWTHYGDSLEGIDIKTIWEPARFTWSFPLCQAYLLTQDEKYPRTFWQNFEKFITANLFNMGPNWSSAQEVALRLIPMLAAMQTFAGSQESSPVRELSLLQLIWQSASRIQLTLNYARAQNNNHFLSEALGLVIAGIVFQEEPQGMRWFHQGVELFQKGILRQVDADGTYLQHSTNYHRLLLHLALLFFSLSQSQGFSISNKVMQRLAQAVRWLAAQMDETSGRVPNLGHNDGSNLLPFGTVEYQDYRPVIQAASRAFLGADCLPPGEWDELSEWLNLKTKSSPSTLPSVMAVNRLGDQTTWATLRSAKFHGRPAHADQLHVDLWHQGINLLMDAGTYAYNLPDPWQNALTTTRVHNTISVAGQDQMVRESKFLYLERASAYTLPADPQRISAILFCNLPIAYTQVRTAVFTSPGRFEILDQIELARLEKEPQPVTIQFLLPDWSWKIDKNLLRIQQDSRIFTLTVSALNPANQSPVPGETSLIRAGETLFGQETNPIRGWFSRTYLEKSPALSFAMTFAVNKSLEIRTILIL